MEDGNGGGETAWRPLHQLRGDDGSKEAEKQVDGACFRVRINRTYCCIGHGDKAKITPRIQSLETGWLKRLR